ncbi:hypothetical protein Tco_0344236 [Tanacetum coccineum]
MPFVRLAASRPSPVWPDLIFGPLRLLIRAVDITRLRFQYSSYPYVLRDYLFLCDVPLSLLGETWVTWPLRGLSPFDLTVYSTYPTVITIFTFDPNRWLGAAKVSHFEILCRVYEITPTVGLFRCFHVDDFACPALFPWHTAKNMTRDPAPAAAGFNAHDYATLVAHPSPFRKFPEEFPPLTDNMDIFAFIHTPDPTKVKVVERERIEDEPRLLETTVGFTVPLLPIAPDRAESELEASVDKLFDEGGSGNQAGQGYSVGVGEGANIQPVTEATDIVPEDVAPLQPRRQRKRKTVVVGAGGKSRSAVQQLLARAVLNAEVRGEPIPTLPFVTSSVSATPGHSSHHSGTNIVKAEVNSLIRSSVPVMTIVTIITSTVDTDATTKEKPVEASLFGAAPSSAGGADPTSGGFSDQTGSDFLVGGISTVIDPDTDLQKVYVPQWNVTNGSRLDDGRVFRKMVDEFAPPKFFASAELLKVREGEIESLKAQLLLKEAEAAEVIRLRAKASKFEAIEKSLQDEMKTLKERNTTLEKEKNDLDVKVTNLAASVAVREREVADLDTLVHELEVSSFGLQEKVTVYENCMEQLEKFQDDRMKEVNDKFDKLYVDFIEIVLHLNERFYPHLLTAISGRRWLLTHGMELAITKYMHSPEYLSALGAAIGKAIEKGMQDGLSARITHGAKGRALIDIAAYNPFAEVDYISALQHLQNVNFSLLADLRSNKDASVDTLMNILRLEETLAERLGLNQVVLGASALSLALDVSNSRVRKIKENIANHRSALRDVFVPLAEPLSITALIGTKGTSNVIPATAETTTALSITFASASTIAPISVYDYEVVGTDNQADVDGNAEPFPNVDDAELNIPQ